MAQPSNANVGEQTENQQQTVATPAAQTHTATPTTPTTTPAVPSAEQIAAAIEARSTRAERSAIKSMAEQYSMSESELTALLDQARAEKAKALPPEVRKQIDDATARANNLLISAEIRTIGAGMGLVDADVAAQLIDRKEIKIGDDGKVTGAKEALEALQKSKPYLFERAAAMAQRQGTANVDDDTAKIRKAMGLPPQK